MKRKFEQFTHLILNRLSIRIAEVFAQRYRIIQGIPIHAIFSIIRVKIYAVVLIVKK